MELDLLASNDSSWMKHVIPCQAHVHVHAVRVFFLPGFAWSGARWLVSGGDGASLGWDPVLCPPHKKLMQIPSFFGCWKRSREVMSASPSLPPFLPPSHHCIDLVPYTHRRKWIDRLLVEWGRRRGRRENTWLFWGA